MDNQVQVCGLCNQPSITWGYNPAGPDPCSIHGGTPCNLYSQLLRLEKDIDVAQQTLLRLVGEHNTLMDQVNERHDPIQRLPVEIVSHIFSLCFPQMTASWSRNIQDCIAPEEFPLMLGKVCRRWRQIAWSTPQLWSTLYVYPGREIYDQQRQISVLPDWIGRSGQLPLTVRVRMARRPAVEGPDLDPLLDIIRSISYRWGALNLYVTSGTAAQIFADGYQHPVQGLQYLGIRLVDVITNRSTQGDISAYLLPTADQIRLDGFRISNYKANWLNTSRLSLRSIWSYQLLDILRRAQNIRSLELSGCSYDEHAGNGDTPIVLPCLRSMVLNRSSSILKYMTAPCLQKFAIFYDSPPVSLIETFLSRGSPSQLKELSFSGSFHRDEVVQLLKSLEQLSSLTVNHVTMIAEGGHSFVDDIFLKYLGSRSRESDGIVSRSFLPCLEHFEYWGLREFAWTSLLPLFGLADVGRDLPCQLKSLKIRISQFGTVISKPTVLHIIDRETTQKLFELGDVVSIVLIHGILADESLEDLDLVKTAHEAWNEIEHM